MKKYAISLCGFMLASLCIYFLQKNTAIFTALLNQNSYNNLFKAIDTNPQQLHFLLSNATQRFRGNPEGFFKYLDQRHPITGLNILLYSGAIGDIASLEEIFKTLKTFYGNNVEAIFRYLDTRNLQGRALLLLSVMISTNKYVTKFVLDQAAQLLGDNKELFFKFLTASDYFYHWNALLEAAFNSRSAAVEFMINKAKQVLGKESPYFEKFINSTNKFGQTPLSLAKNVSIQLLLKQYGGKNTTSLEGISAEDYERAQKYGLALIESTNRSDSAKFNGILAKAKTLFVSEPRLLFQFLSTQDLAGWNVLMHVAADNQIDYLNTIFNYCLENFKGNDLFYFFLMLVTVDINGRNLLNIAISRKNYQLTKIVIDRLLKIVGERITLFFVFLNNADELNGFTILINAAFNNNFGETENNEFIRYLIQVMNKFFDKRSRIFKFFINAEDYNKATALSYIIDPNTRKFMESYGATQGRTTYHNGSSPFLGTNIR